MDLNLNSRANLISVLYKSTVFFVDEEHKKNNKNDPEFSQQHPFSSLIGNELELDEEIYVNKDCWQVFPSLLFSMQ